MRMICIATTLLWLTGCASQSAVLALREAHPIPTPITVVAPTPPLSELEVKTEVENAQFPVGKPLSMWTASGKFSVKMLDADGRKKGGSAYFVWQQDANDYHVTLTGPLGQGRTVLIGSSTGVVMDSSKTGRVEATSPEQLFEQAFGWTAPVSYLKHWLEGKPATAHPEDIYAENGTLQSAQEGEWQADFKNYRYVDTELLPQKIIITGPNLTMTVLVGEWRKQAVKL